MQLFNSISTTVFDVLLAPFGHGVALFDLILWPALLGVMAILVYKAVSNQAALTRVKSQISMRLLEIRLFSHDIVQVLKSTGSILWKNTIYLGNHMIPMAVMIVPFMAVMAQLVANYAYAPSPTGAVELLHVKLDPESGVSSQDVQLAIPDGVALEVPAVKTADGQVFWRLRADEPGDHVLSVFVGDEIYEKHWAVGGDDRKIPTRRLRGIESFLYPSEPTLPAGGPVLSMEMDVHSRSLPFLPDGELGVVLWTLILSLGAGFAVKGVFGVTI
ncbi:MAG: hypothetical protein QNK05_09250 [Myxococcota bacterium]|nr:hypothetical protein [Myxococcota bacterium]